MYQPKSDVFRCEGLLFDSTEALVRFAKRRAEVFITYTNTIIDEVEVTDDFKLSIAYRLEDEEDAEPCVETFDVEIETLVHA